MISIGITGGIGSGKSFVCEIFKRLGVPVYYADQSAKNIVNTHIQVKNSIIDHFGDNSYENNTYNRDFIASIVFNNKEKLALLNSIIHPAVSKDFHEWKKQQNFPYILKEAALLFETGSYKVLDRVLLVDAPEQLRIKRILARDSFRTIDEIKAIINKQWPHEKKKQLADDFINNDGTKLLIPQVLKLHSFYLSLSTPL